MTLRTREERLGNRFRSLRTAVAWEPARAHDARVAVSDRYSLTATGSPKTWEVIEAEELNGQKLQVSRTLRRDPTLRTTPR